MEKAKSQVQSAKYKPRSTSAKALCSSPFALANFPNLPLVSSVLVIVMLLLFIRKN
jgi:hypothetical protein